jgi:hypothetical protein
MHRFHLDHIWPRPLQALQQILNIQLVGIPPSRCVLVTLLHFVQEIEALIDEIKHVRARL